MNSTSHLVNSATRWVALSLAALLVLSCLSLTEVSSANRWISRPKKSQESGRQRRVSPLTPQPGPPEFALPNLDDVRRRHIPEPKAPQAIASTMPSRRKAKRTKKEKKSHHARSYSAANVKLPAVLFEPQSGPPTFTDDPLKDPNNPESFKIKALHVTELRTWINALRGLHGLPNYVWQKPTASGGAINSSVLVSWEPIDEMRTALNEALGAPANGYAQGLGLGQSILAAHIQELRDRVKAEWGSPLADQLVPARIDLLNQAGNQVEARDCEWGIPLISLPGRAGLDFGIGLTYSSMVWTRAGSDISFDDDSGDPSPGFKIGFPTIQGRFTDTQVGVNVYLLITSAGRRVELRRVGNSNIYEAGDSSYLQLIDFGSSLLVRTTDGTQMSYSKSGSDWHCASIEDRNGNLISATYDGGDIVNITDTLGRVFTLNYDGNRNLQSITQTWTVNGVSQSHAWATFGWGTLTLQPSFSGVTLMGTYSGEVIPVLTQVGLDDGSRYNFEYTANGQVNAIRRYTSSDNVQRSYTAYDYQATYNQGASDCPRIYQARVWAENWNGFNGVPSEVATSFADNGDGSHQMTTPDGTIYKEFYGSTSEPWKHGLVTASQVLTGGTTVQKTTTTTWTQDNTIVNYQTNPRVTETTVSDGTNNRRTTIGYQTFALPTTNASCSLPNQVDKYAANGTTVLRRTHTDYNLDSAYLGQHIIGLPQAQLLYEGNSTLMAKTTYVYDSGGEYLQNTSASPVQHDNSNYTTDFTVGRGNVTKVQRWDVNYPTDTNKITENQVGYDVTGNILFTRDALNHQTTVSYADSFSENPNSRNTFAYPTVVKDADWNSSTAPNNYSTVQYNYDFGARTRVQGPPPQNQTSGIVQTFTYDDAARLKRATVVSTGAYSHYEYGPNYTSNYASVNTVSQNSYDSDSFQIQYFDGLGRVINSAGLHPNSTGWYRSQLTYYDAMGRAVKQSNPTEVTSSLSPTGDDAAGYQFNMANTFDWKGRPLRVYNMDGTYKEASYAGCGCAGGEVVTLTDEVARQQKIYSDVLGRQWKTEVLNFDGSVYSTTETTLNARDQQTLVSQFSGNDQSSVYQDTTMSYDGYGRLQSKHVPEQNAGTATIYSYNNDDTVQSVTDARGASVTYIYNNNRHLVTGITYSAPSGVTPTSNVSFGYDVAGNRTSMTDGLGSKSYSYNSLSQLTSETRTFADPSPPYLNGSYTLSYDYNLAGELKRITDATNMTINYSFDSTGRLNGVTGADNLYANVSNYASNFQYRAWGGLKAMTDGSNHTSSLLYNSKLQPSQFDISGSIAHQNYDYYNDGRISFVHNNTDANFDRSYSYDHLGRLTEAKSGGQARNSYGDTPYSESFGYDAFSSLTTRQSDQWNGYFSDSDSASYANNRRIGWGYDADGRNTTLGSRSNLFDAAGRQIQMTAQQVLSNGNHITVSQGNSYDGDGRSVSETISGVTTYHLRSSALGGEIVEDLNSSGQKTVGYVSLPGQQLLATQTGQAVIWKHNTPAGTSEYTFNTYNTAIGRTEFDPLGADVSLTQPTSPPPNEGDGDVGAGHLGGIMDQRWADFFNLDSGFTVNGFSISSSEAMFYINFGTGNRSDTPVSPKAVADALGVKLVGPGASSANFRVSGVEGIPGHQTLEYGWQDLGNGWSVWTLVSTSYSGIASMAGSIVDLSTDVQAQQPQNPATQVMAPIGGLDKMKSQLEKALNYSDCREAMQKLLAQIGVEAKFAPSHTDIMDLFNALRNQTGGGGVFVDIPHSRMNEVLPESAIGSEEPGGGGLSGFFYTDRGNWRTRQRWSAVFLKGGFSDRPAPEALPYLYLLTLIHEITHNAPNDSSEQGRIYQHNEMNAAAKKLGVSAGFDQYVREHCIPKQYW